MHYHRLARRLYRSGVAVALRDHVERLVYWSDCPQVARPKPSRPASPTDHLMGMASNVRTASSSCTSVRQGLGAGKDSGNPPRQFPEVAARGEVIDGLIPGHQRLVQAGMQLEATPAAGRKNCPNMRAMRLAATRTGSERPAFLPNGLFPAISSRPYSPHLLP
jgi:hypothetical protein